ncbi:MAG: SusC/RagA family TonB-linked outer membrane protein, partial [Phocaeicola plebeius]
TNVPSSAQTLMISFIGMRTQEVKAQQVLNVVLKPESEMIDEVMVVAYGTAKKSSFTGSAASVDGKKIAKLQVASVSKALEGAAAGVTVVSTSGQPGENSKIRIRGIGSFSASSAPLYVVDGMPYDEASVNAINPADIENLSILKDAASAALYGSRAANGVVMITTKKGKQDMSSVNVDARWGVNTRAIPEYDIMKDPRDYVKTAWMVLNNQKGAEYASTELINSIGYNPFVGVDNNAMVATDGTVTSGRLRHNDNWADEALHNGLRQEYNLSLQGGNTKTTHFLSLGYLKDEGILRNTDFERISTRANITHVVNKFIDLTGSLAYARGEKNAGQSQGASLSNYSNAFMFTQQIAPIYPVYAYDEQGNRQYDDNGDVIYDFGDGKYSTRMGGYSNQNVAANSSLDVHQTLNDNFTGRGTINLSPFKGFKLTANLGYDLQNQVRTDHMNQLYGDASKVNGRTYKYNIRVQTLTANQLATYENTIGKHSFDVMAGHESYSYIRNYQYTQKYNFYTLGNPEFNNAITMSDMYSYKQEHSMESYFGRANYSYDDKYYLSASIRTDSSSKFHPDHRRGTFWSVGGSWRLSQEEWLKEVEWLSNLKLKASYGTQGNDGILDADGNMVYQPYMKQYNISNNNGQFSAVETYRGNKELTWEKSQNLNVGVESAFFDSRLKLDVDYFLRKTTDMLYNMPYPISSGIAYIPMNLLDMKNQGIEFTVSGTPVRTRDFTWNVSFNGTHYSNKILSLPEDKRKDGIIHGTSSLFRLMEGGSIYDLYTYEYAGVNPETGAAQWYMDEKDAQGNVTGRTVTEDYTKASKYALGTTLPDFQGGLSMDFTYKNFDLSIGTNFQLGGQLYDSMYQTFMHAGSSMGTNWHKDILNAWTPENKLTDVPVLDGQQNTNSQSSRFLISASYFNIRNISLGYTFPKAWMKAIQANTARIYVAADNVAMFSKRKGLDPRQYTYGYSAANYSAIRALSLGININF